MLYINLNLTLPSLSLSISLSLSLSLSPSPLPRHTPPPLLPQPSPFVFLSFCLLLWTSHSLSLDISWIFFLSLLPPPPPHYFFFFFLSWQLCWLGWNCMKALELWKCISFFLMIRMIMHAVCESSYSVAIGFYFHSASQLELVYVPVR